jgi:hypothetical protein
MDVRLTSEQKALRAAAARLADDLGPGSVHELEDAERVGRLEKAVDSTGWRSLRSDGASAVEVALVAEEFGRGLVDVPFLGPVLADELTRQAGRPAAAGAETPGTVAIDGLAIDSRGCGSAYSVNGNLVLAGRIGRPVEGTDLTRQSRELLGPLDPAFELAADVARRWRALAVVATTADLVGVARGALTLAVDYARIREQYGRPIGSFQGVSHPLAEALALIEGSISVLRHAAWAVDELSPSEATRAAQIAKVYCSRATRTVVETSIQVHGGIGNTWECLAHVFLRRGLASTDLFPVRLKEIDLGLS